MKKTLSEQVACYSLGKLPPAFLLTGSDLVSNHKFALAYACSLVHERIEAPVFPDIQLITPEKNIIQIDQIRECIAWVTQTSHRGFGKVVIIEPAEAMNHAAMNGLLKILEEPPADVLFILITAQSQLLLPTIRSRCERLIGQDKEEAVEWLQQHPEFLSDFTAVLKNQQSILLFSKKWSTALEFVLPLLWLFFLENEKARWGIAPTVFSSMLFQTQFLPERWDFLKNCEEAILHKQKKLNVNPEWVLINLLLQWREHVS